MALDDRARWDEKHAAERATLKPSGFLKEIFEADSWPIPKDRALDIAAGKDATRSFWRRAVSSDGDRYLASCLGHGAAGCQRKIPDHRLARGGSRKDRTACGSLRSGPVFQLLAALPVGANQKDAQ